MDKDSIPVTNGWSPSPNRYARQRDESMDGSGDKFDIPPKNAPVERLRRWRQAALVLNASRRFRYTLDLKKEEEKEQIRRKIRSHAQVIRAALLFKAAGERVHHEVPGLSDSGYGIGSEQLNAMTKDHNFTTLQSYGGVKGKLNTNPEKGITGDEADILHRRHTFGANTYP